jgi:hypothetical protein
MNGMNARVNLKFTEAAVKVQALYRGHLSRKNFEVAVQRFLSIASSVEIAMNEELRFAGLDFFKIYLEIRVSFIIIGKTNYSFRSGVDYVTFDE